METKKILDEFIEHAIAKEFDKREQQLLRRPLNAFCREHNLNRSTIWRGEKNGTVKGLYRFGKRIFVNPNEFWDSEKFRDRGGRRLP